MKCLNTVAMKNTTEKIAFEPIKGMRGQMFQIEGSTRAKAPESKACLRNC